MNTNLPEICHLNLAKTFRGGERQTYLLIRQLALLFPQTAVVRNGSPLSSKLAQLVNVKVIEIKKPFLFNIFKLKKFDFLHAHEANGAQLAYIAFLFLQVPYLITRRVDNVPGENFFTKQVYRNADKIVAISSKVEQVMRSYDHRINVRIIPSSYASLNFAESSVKELKQKYRDKFVIGNVGALVDSHKGQMQIIKAAEKLSVNYPDMHFIFVGEGRDEKLFRNAAQGCGNIDMVGFKSNVGDYYKLFDVFVYPSHREGLGSAILDAFYFRVPVIASDAGGIPDLVKHERTGLVIKPGQVDRLCESIVRLYKNRGFAEKIGENGYQSLQSFDISKTAEKYADLYNRIIRGADRT